MGRRAKADLAHLLGDLEIEKRHLESREAAEQTVVRSGPKDTVLRILRAVNARHADLVRVPPEDEILEERAGVGDLFNTRSLISHIDRAMRRIAGELGVTLYDTSMWQAGCRRRVFISYESEKGLAYATDLRKALLSHRFDAFVAKHAIAPSRRWATEIESALATCDACVPILTSKFHKSEWTDQEIGHCLNRRVPIISVGRGGTPRGFMRFLQALPDSGTMDVAASIAAILLSPDRTSARWAFGRRNAGSPSRKGR